VPEYYVSVGISVIDYILVVKIKRDFPVIMCISYEKPVQDVVFSINRNKE